MKINNMVFEMINDMGRFLNDEYENPISGVRHLYTSWRVYRHSFEDPKPRIDSPRGIAAEEVTHWVDIARLGVESAKACRENPDMDEVIKPAITRALKALVRYAGLTLEPEAALDGAEAED